MATCNQSEAKEKGKSTEQGTPACQSEREKKKKKKERERKEGREGRKERSSRVRGNFVKKKGKDG